MKVLPYKTEREITLRDHYMYFIERDDEIPKNIINAFKKDSESIMEENYLYHSILRQNKLIKKNENNNSRKSTCDKI
jgi:hypothetical protein